MADQTPDTIEPGLALCLSGGGYRAMVFHLGALIRLNEAGVLGRLARVSSVSGGSITAGVLGLHWQNLGFVDGVATRLGDLVVDPLRAMARETIDVESVLGGLLSTDTISDEVARAYDEHLFHGATLQDLPARGEGPRFVINATSVQSGALWRFSRPYMADYLVGEIKDPDLPLALAVGASSAFPPFLSPVTIELDPRRFVPDPRCPLQRPPFTERAVLTDGGVYDNLGLETAWKRYRTLLVSDGGGRMAAEESPKNDWARHMYRVLNVIDNQVRSLRKRMLIDAFARGDEHDGTYWGIRTDVRDYGLADALDCPVKATTELADTPTRLAAMTDRLQERLINWGYAVSDAAIRRHLAAGIDTRRGFPYPGGVE